MHGRKLNDAQQKAKDLFDDVHKIEKLMQRYNLSFDKAFRFNILKSALKANLGYGGKDNKSLVEVSHKVQVDRLVKIGKEFKFTEQQVKELLPAFSLKLQASETKCMLAAFKGGIFSNPREFSTALKEIEGKYETRFGLK